MFTHKIERATIRQQILYPFMAIIITLPLSILIAFNIAINYYSQSMAKQELRNTKNTASSLMNANSKITDDSTELTRTLQMLAFSLTSSKLAGNTDFFLLNHNQLIYPTDLTGTLMTPELRSKILTDPVPADNEIYKRQVEHTTFYLTATPLNAYKDLGEITMLFVSNGSTADDLLKTINIVMTVVILSFIVISITIYIGISTKISKPITEIAFYAKEIGSGNFINVPVVSSSEEIYQLTYNINDMSEKLKEADSVQKKFLQNASHELRTPLMSIQGYAEGIQSDIIDAKDAAKIIRSESIRMNKLVDELLTLSRIENQTYKINLREMDLATIVPEFIQSVNGFAMKNGITITSDIRGPVPATVDESLLAQIVINIISNCIRYAKTSVHVVTRYANNVALIRISDDGDGFSDEDIQHIFERFYKGKGGNFGLGLSIAKSAAEYLNGNITIRNAPGSGAVFEVRFINDKNSGKRD